MADRILHNENKVQRHTFSAILVHWLVAIATSILIFSGIGQMPMYKRYMIDRLPGLGWASNYGLTLGLHYAFAVVLVFAGMYHIVYHGLRKDSGLLPRRGDLTESWRIIKAMLTRGEEPPSDKYLAEQRISYALTAVSLILVIMTGMVKVYKNLPGASIPHGVVVLSTNLHNAGTFLVLVSVLGHLGAFLFKPNRRLIPGILTGKIDLGYAKHRHSLWYARLRGDSRRAASNRRSL